MPTAEQCKTYAAGYQRLEQEADISIQRAFGSLKWWEKCVPEKPTSTPMEIQPVAGPRSDAIPRDRRRLNRHGRAVRRSPPARRPC